MSVAMPKRQAREPIDLDIIVVCRKRACLTLADRSAVCWDDVHSRASAQTQRLRDRGRGMSRNDVRIIVMSQLIMDLSRLRSSATALTFLDTSGAEIERLIGILHGGLDREGAEIGA